MLMVGEVYADLPTQGIEAPDNYRDVGAPLPITIGRERLLKARPERLRPIYFKKKLKVLQHLIFFVVFIKELTRIPYEL